MTMRLLGDIGGTNARFALQQPGREPGPVSYMRTADYPSLAAAITHFLQSTPVLQSTPARHRPQHLGLAIAAPVEDDRVSMVNNSWSFSIAALRARLGFNRAIVLNDFEALAHALPGLGPADLSPIGGGQARPGAPRIVLGPGTGMGMAILVDTPSGPQAIATEAGHATLAAADDSEAEILAILRGRFGHVSAERAISGAGLVNLYEAAATAAGSAPAVLSPTDVTARARQGTDPHATRALAMFLSFLGTYAGNAALMAGARGGVYIGGGIVRRILPALAASAFRARFIAKGRYRSYLDAIPTAAIIRPDPTFLGLAAYLDRLDPSAAVTGSGP